MLDCYQKMSNDVCQIGWKLQTLTPQRNFKIGMMQWKEKRESEKGSSERKTMQRKMSRNSMQKLCKTQSK
ncbi:hypothetical protein BT93_D2148 [Corymbia citriodora subsp. variegata]|nr:hypothetical protein BT93_D2148 [Corymbia citriodora subsp. variegata]